MTIPEPFARLLILVAALAVSACGGAPATSTTPRPPGPTVTAENLLELEQAYWRLDPDDPSRLSLRDSLIAYHASDEAGAIPEDYDQLAARMEAVSAFLRPEDLDRADVPAALAPLAEALVRRGSPRGDEGRVMGALLILSVLDEAEREAHEGERQTIAEWGVDARRGVRNPIERYGALIRVWSHHRLVAPSSAVLERQVELYRQQRNALLHAAEGPERYGPRFSFAQFREAPLIVQRAPLDIAAVYLAYGMLPEALRAVEALGADGGLQQQLRELLSNAQRDDSVGAGALEELAVGYVRARPEITLALCRLGARMHPQDSRFPLCLARVAHQSGRFARSTAWYAEAVRLAPAERDVYDESLSRLEEAIEAGVFQADGNATRRIGESALSILDEREARWPDDEPTVTRAELLLNLGRAEMSQGMAERAERSLRESLTGEVASEAHRELGLLLARLGRTEEAIDHYEEALEETDTPGTEGDAARAEIRERLADTYRMAGDEAQATRHYREALSTWNQIGSRNRQDPLAALVLVRRGVLLDRLGRAPEARAAFRQTLDAAPGWREPYAAILSHLVVSEPSLELAQEVFRRAQFQLTLGEEWKVYFALWVQAVASRASAAPAGDVQQLLADLADSGGWSGQLAAFGQGRLSYEELQAAADDAGQRAEAAFYQGTRLLGAGDIEGARAAFTTVIGTRMVSFYEYAMAQELLRALPALEGESAALER